MQLNIVKIENTRDIKIEIDGFDFHYLLREHYGNSVLLQEHNENHILPLKSFHNKPEKAMPDAIHYILDGFLVWN